MTSNGPDNSISYTTTCPLSNDSDQSPYFALIRQTPKLSLDERWAHMQSCRNCCASAEILEILLAGFIFTVYFHLYMYLNKDFDCVGV